MTAKPPGQSTSFFTGASRVFGMSIGEMLWSRRTIFMALVVGSPVLVALVARIVQSSGIAPLRVNGVQVDAVSMFGAMIWILFLSFIVPVLGVFYGTSLIADEVDDKTITYLFTRPIPRGAVLLGKYLAFLACTIFVVLPSVVIVWLLIVPIGGSLAASFLDLVKDLGLLALGLAIYGAVFALIGAGLKRPLLVGLALVFVWEPLVMALPGYLKLYTVAYYLQGLVPHAMPSDSTMSLIQSIFQEAPSFARSMVTLTLVVVGCLWLAMRAIERKEYVLEQ